MQPRARSSFRFSAVATSQASWPASQPKTPGSGCPKRCRAWLAPWRWLLGLRVSQGTFRKARASGLFFAPSRAAVQQGEQGPGTAARCCRNSRFDVHARHFNHVPNLTVIPVADSPSFSRPRMIQSTSSIKIMAAVLRDRSPAGWLAIISLARHRFRIQSTFTRALLLPGEVEPPLPVIPIGARCRQRRHATAGKRNYCWLGLQTASSHRGYAPPRCSRGPKRTTGQQLALRLALKSHPRGLLRLPGFKVAPSLLVPVNSLIGIQFHLFVPQFWVSCALDPIVGPSQRPTTTASTVT